MAFEEIKNPLTEKSPIHQASAFKPEEMGRSIISNVSNASPVVVIPKSPEDSLDDFVYKWVNSDEWRGVYLFRTTYLKPTDVEALQEALIFIKNSPYYVEHDNIYLKPYSTANKEEGDVATESETFVKELYSRILKRTGISRFPTDITNYEEFVKVEKNYLVKLQYLDELGSFTYRLTKLGERFSEAKDLNEMKKILEISFIGLRWWEENYPIHPYQFLLRVLVNLENHALTTDEYKFIVMHAKSDSQLDDILAHIRTLRLMPNKIKEYSDYLEEVRKKDSPEDYKDELVNFNNRGKDYFKTFSLLEYFDLKANVLKLVDVPKAQQLLIDSPQIIRDTEIAEGNRLTNINKLKDAKAKARGSRSKVSAPVVVVDTEKEKEEQDLVGKSFRLKDLVVKIANSRMRYSRFNVAATSDKSPYETMANGFLVKIYEKEDEDRYGLFKRFSNDTQVDFEKMDTLNKKIEMAEKSGKYIMPFLVKIVSKST